jgi:ABC-2 type transport system permease protein/oleandomycin transport system permease protein
MGAALRSIALITERNVRGSWRTPQYLLVKVVLQPVLFLLLFVYVFGGAIQVPDASYVDFLLPGILVQTAMFGGLNTGIALTQDLKSGLMDRFWSLPMSRFGVVIARVLTDTLLVAVGIAIMLGVGMLAGFRFHGDLSATLAALATAVVFAFATAWIGAAIGVAGRTPAMVQAVGILIVFPLTFASSMFVPVATMPSWLQAFAERTPITVTVDSVRHLVLGLPLGGELNAVTIWVVAILTVSVGMASFFYRRLMA